MNKEEFIENVIEKDLLDFMTTEEIKNKATSLHITRFLIWLRDKYAK